MLKKAKIIYTNSLHGLVGVVNNKSFKVEGNYTGVDIKVVHLLVGSKEDLEIQNGNPMEIKSAFY